MSAIDSKVIGGPAPAPLSARVPPQLYFVGAAIFHYLGPAFAVLLFARVPASGVAWLRIVSAGLVFAVWRAPWRVFRASDPRTRWLIISLGAVFACMNYAFYAAIDRLPLGTVAAIEFLGPLLLALVGLRTPRNLAALAISVVGVGLLSEVRLEGGVDGFLWAFANAGLFTIYIHLAHRLARSDPHTTPIDRLGAAMLVAALVITPLGIGAALPALRDPVALAGGIGVGLSSSVIPYVLDQLALTRISRSTYSLFVALLPATAVLIAVLVLHQVPTPLELLAIGLIIGAVLIHREARRES